MAWRTYVALGDSLSAGRGDTDLDGARNGWARRLAGLLTKRTGMTCHFTNLARDGAIARDVIDEQLPALPAADLISLTIGMNDVQLPTFCSMAFARELDQIFQALAETRATILASTLPDIAGLLSIPPELVPIAQDRMSQASDAIREHAAAKHVVLLDAWREPEVCDLALYNDDRMRHPNAKGHQLIATRLADLLAER